MIRHLNDRIMDALSLEYIEHLLPDDEEVKHVINDVISVMLNDLFHAPIIILVFLIAICLSLWFMINWKVKQDPFHSSNEIIFIGQMFLASALFCCYESIKVFNVTPFKSFTFCSISCYFFALSMILSYDFRRPPSHRLGFLLFFVGSIAHVVLAVYVVHVGKDTAKIPCIMSLNLFGIGATILVMNMLKGIYEDKLLIRK